MKIDLPVGSPPVPPSPPQIVQIDVAADGAIDWNGVRVPDAAALDARFSEVAAQADQAETRLRPDKRPPYGSVAGVLAAAQRKGATKIGLVGNEQYVQ